MLRRLSITLRFSYSCATAMSREQACGSDRAIASVRKPAPTALAHARPAEATPPTGVLTLIWLAAGYDLTDAASVRKHLARTDGPTHSYVRF